jgi:c(7)-type cytochrome triheme protein
MEPEYTAYKNSPHARVACVSCHVGPGAEWFVRSKLSGAYQVYSVLFEKYSRPIPTPVHNLRPAQGTCEQCHWPAKFWGKQLAERVHFGSDEKNTRREVQLLLKTGGGPQSGMSEGIHYHMNIANKVWYAAGDERRQVIPWVKIEYADGSSREYLSREKPVTPEQLKKLEIRRMDCMDCHNRPSHKYLPPGRALDPSLEAGKIATELPFIKKVAVEAMVQPYETTEQAARGIEKYIRDYYADRQPQVMERQAESLKGAIAEVIRVYRQNFFPYMRVNWQAYPDNIGHKEFPGCFRCHEGRHASADGKIITRNCSACHEFLEKREGGETLVRVAATPAFAHPWKLGGKHAEIRCGECHSGGPAKPATCAGCHRHPTAGPMSGMACKECHRQEQQVKPLVGCGSCHADLAGLHRKKEHRESGCAACHAPHTWSAEPRKSCLACHADKAQHNPGPPCAECHDFRAAGTTGQAGAAKAGPAAFKFPADPGSPGKVAFDHARHLAKGGKCADCHPGLFAMKRGTAKLEMDGMGAGKTCGACHNGQKAFGVTDGDTCTTCHKA